MKTIKGKRDDKIKRAAGILATVLSVSVCLTVISACGKIQNDNQGALASEQETSLEDIRTSADSMGSTQEASQSDDAAGITGLQAADLQTVAADATGSQTQPNESDTHNITEVNTAPEEKPLGDTGKPFVNDYDPSDRTYAASDNYISPKGERGYGETITVSYYSSTLGIMRNADVILPYGYTASSSYPVLYMLHGMGGNNKSWSDMGVKYIVQNLHYENNVPDMIVVCVDCFVSTADQSEVAFTEMGRAYDRVEYEIINDLMPYVNANYSTKTGRSNTAVAGYSLGGRGALAIGFKHQDMFGYIGAFSAASGVIPNPSGSRVLSTQMEDFVTEYGDFPMLLINLGETDGVCGDACRFYDEALTERGIKHIFYEMEGDHEGTVWQNGLYNFVKRIF